MTGTNHAITGALIATVTTRPIIALPAALLSHFIIDTVPHWNYKLPDGVVVKRIAIISDLALSVVVTGLIAFLVSDSWWLTVLAAGLAILPDTMWLPNMLYDKPTKPDSSLIGRLRLFHMKIQWSETTAGALVEVAWFFAVLCLVIYLSN